MDPEIKKNPPATPSITDADSTIKDLNDAGVEISARISENNEFSETPGEQIEAVLPEPQSPQPQSQPEPNPEQVKPAITAPVAVPVQSVAVPPAQSAVRPTPTIPVASISSEMSAIPATPSIYSATVKNAPTPKPTPKESPVQPRAQSPIQNEISAALGNPGGMNKTPLSTDNTYKNDPSIRQLRTFKTDAEEAVRYQNVSKVGIAVAEHKKKEEANLIQYDNGPKRSMGPLAIVLIILILLVGAGAGGYYWFFIKNTQPTERVTQTFSAQTIVPYDKIGTITPTGNNPLPEIAQNLAAANTQIGQLYALIALPVGTTTVSLPLASLFKETQIPERLMRSLGADYMIGDYIFKQDGPFIILKNTFFQNAFAGMLEWEKNIRNDLISIIRVNHPDEQPITANSDIFSDTVVSNIDARVLNNEKSVPILVYAFADKNTIVIATNIDTLKYVIDRLLSVRVVQ